MPLENPYKEAERIYKDKHGASINIEELRKWQEEWKKRGPIEFAYNILRIDPLTNKPLQLSDGQKEFLYDLWAGGIYKAIIMAGRGSGKTFVLAIYICWRVVTHGYWDISSMGGSSEQSEKIQAYITGWRIHSDELSKMVVKDVKRKLKTRAPSTCIFMSCSGASVRGPHTMELIIDEEAEAEAQGKTKQVRAALWEISTSQDFHIVKSSTAHFLHGDFLHTWNNAEKLGYKKYTWSIARHISGNPDIYAVYTDEEPTHWLSAVPWIPDRNIQELRLEKSNDEWLVEALGGIGLTAGMVYNPADFNSVPFGIVCDRCDICQPYKENYCPLVQFMMEMSGVPKEQIPLSTKDALKHVNERIEGIDWGRYEPCAYTIFGRFKELVFVLYSEELVGVTDRAKVDRAEELARQWEVSIIRPDPAQFPFNSDLMDRGFSIHELFSFEGGQEKYEYVHCAKKHVERHIVIIPKAYAKLIESLREISWDDNGKIRKENDHSHDSFIYGISYYCETASIGDWSMLTKIKENSTLEGIKPLWGNEYIRR